MKVKDLRDKRILVKYGPPENPYQYAVDLLKFYRERVYEPIYKKGYSFGETEFRYESNLSRVPYSKTDRCIMPANYQCMGSLPVTFIAPDRSISPVAFVDFLHTNKRHSHHNTHVRWRNPDGSTGNCHNHDIEGHDTIDIERDMNISLWADGKEVFKDTIPGRKAK